MPETQNERAGGAPRRQEKDYGEELFPDRKRRADRYYDLHLRGQRNWYSRNAGKAKTWSGSLAFIVLAAGASTSLIQMLSHEQSWARLVTASLGAAVFLAEGLGRIGRYNETWIGYRRASESMKREYRLYINNAGEYTEAEDENEAYRWFVEQVERVIAEEQNQFFQIRGRAQSKGNVPSKKSDGNEGSPAP